MDYKYVTLVRPGSSFFEYEDDIRNRKWLALNIHPMAFTIPEALLFCRQDKEDIGLWRDERGHDTSPHRKAVFLAMDYCTRRDLAWLRIELPQNGAWLYKYRGETFNESLEDFAMGIEDVHIYGDECDRQGIDPVMAMFGIKWPSPNL